MPFVRLVKRNLPDEPVDHTIARKGQEDLMYKCVGLYQMHKQQKAHITQMTHGQAIWAVPWQSHDHLPGGCMS